MLGLEGRGRVFAVCVYNIDLSVKNQTGGKRNLVGKKKCSVALSSVSDGISDLNLSVNKLVL